MLSGLDAWRRVARIIEGALPVRFEQLGRAAQMVHLAVIKGSGGTPNGIAEFEATLEDYEAVGRRTTARRCLHRAAGLSNDTADTARTRLAETGYAIQFGSFSSRDNATRQAAAVSREVARRGIGDVRVHVGVEDLAQLCLADAEVGRLLLRQPQGSQQRCRYVDDQPVR